MDKLLGLVIGWKRFYYPKFSMSCFVVVEIFSLFAVWNMGSYSEKALPDLLWLSVQDLANQGQTSHKDRPVHLRRGCSR